MKIIITLLIINLFTYFDNNISKINEIKKEAKKNFSEKKYDQAIDKYKYLIDSMNLNDDNVMLNLSHSYLLNGDTLNAIDGYNSLTTSKKGNIKSIAYQQLGVISDKYQKLKESSELFKNSIKSNPENVESKYNYELVMKKIKEQENKEQQNQENKEQQNQENKEQENKDQQNQENKKQQNQENKDQQNQENKKQQNQENKDQQNQENKDQQNQENKDQQNQENKEQQNQTVEEKLKEINISKEKAEMILEALKNNEIQYLQQLKRKSSKKVDKSKPDW